MSDNNKPLILIVEDDRRLSQINRRALESEECEVKTAFTLREARLLLADCAPDVILLDVKLPDGNGFDFCREIRECHAAHIIFLTSVTESEGEMEGLVSGGDDYLRKPYGIELLRVRVRKALQNGRKAQILARGSLTLDMVAGQGYIDGTDLFLTQKEFAVLLLLIQNEGKTLGAEYIYQKAWGQPMAGNKNAVQKVVSRLRKKIVPAGYVICAERGSGYRFAQEN
ncbi:DNA-binding response regulator [Clostridia bacterium]|nr:DNA-binding response regulator [Clostridia bacterium]